MAKSYSEHLAKANHDAESEEEALIEAHTTIAALGLVKNIAESLERDAEELANKWLNEYRLDRRSLSHDRQEAYRRIMEMSASAMDVGIVRPEIWMQPNLVKEASISASLDFIFL